MKYRTKYGLSRKFNRIKIINGEAWIFIDDEFDNFLTEKMIKKISEFKHVKFGEKFNHEINNLPDGLKSIEFNSKFNQTIDNLPNSLENLILKGNFNQKIDNLPLNLKKLDLGYSFNQKIDYLPESLETLILSYYFNQKISFLPIGLKELSIQYYRKDFNNLPQQVFLTKNIVQLQIRTIFRNDNLKDIKQFFPNLKKLILPPQTYGELPKNVHIIRL